jgi:hypothetical protein
MSRVSLSALADLVDVPNDPPAPPSKAEKPVPVEQQKPPRQSSPGPTAGGVVPTSAIAAVSASQKQAAVATTPAPTPAAHTPLHADRPKQTQSAPAPVETSHMRWHEYERKETRLREDQYGRLTAASRRLNKLRRTRGERITENTLIRVAIDLLLNEEAKLAGVDETELRQSVGL